MQQRNARKGKERELAFRGRRRGKAVDTVEARVQVEAVAGLRQDRERCFEGQLLAG